MNTAKHIAIMLVMLTCMASSALAATAQPAADSYRYVLDLEPSQALHELYIASKPELNRYRLYTIRRDTDELIDYRIRLGFFRTRAQAHDVLLILQRDAVSGNVERVQQDETAIVALWWRQTVAVEEAIPEAMPVAAWMQRADRAMQAGQYTRAIGLYSKIAAIEHHELQQVALEKLALARERNRQWAHAVADYRTYLARYPETDGAARVELRLNRLSMRQVPGNEATLASRSETRPGVAQTGAWRHDGSLYQFYHRNSLDVDGQGEFTPHEVVSTSIQYLGRNIDSTTPIEIGFAATDIHDLQDSNDDDSRVTSMYIDVASAHDVFDIRLGRQKIKHDALFNRFDGIEAGYRLSVDIKARLIAGYPVESSETVADSNDKYFYSAALTLHPEHTKWRSNLYYIEQTADDVLDRREIAVDTRYQADAYALYSVLDYSLQYDTLNLFYAAYNKYYPNRSWLNVVASYRKNPFLATTNALIGQLDAATLGDLLASYTEDELEQLTRDRTASYRALSAYYMHYIDNDLQINTDITASSLSGTVASAGVEAFQDSGTEYSYALGLTRRNLFANNDMYTLNLRRSNLASSNRWLLNANSRFRLGSNWQIKPGVAYSTQDYNDGSTTTTIRPLLNIKNRLSRHWQLELELARDDRKTEAPATAASDETSTQIYAGYIYNF